MKDDANCDVPSTMSYNVHFCINDANKAFIGADGVSLASGISSYDEKEASITLKMVDNADEVFLLCDSSKIERKSFFKFAPFSKIDHFITNDDINPQYLKEYIDAGIHVVIE